MSFDVGDKVVYPHHGAAIVERREVREAFGDTKEYLVLRLAYGDLTLMVPSDNTDDVGLKIYLYGRAQSVMGGTSQIQKNIVATRILGLPVA